VLNLALDFLNIAEAPDDDLLQVNRRSVVYERKIIERFVPPKPEMKEAEN
jgi:hypothetical protein